LSKTPNATVTGQVGRTTSFEVTVNGQRVFSKLDRGGFPDFDEIADIVRDAQAGEKIVQAEKSSKSCAIL